MSSLTVNCLDTHPELLLIRPRVHRDERGFFAERWSERGFAELDSPAFVHENHSRSQRGTLRGMHYQAPPYAQGKLVSVVAGSIFDVSVDLRTQSPRYGRWDAAILDGSEPTWLWIPPGFAHGFLALSETADVVYKVSAPYAQEAEGGLA